MVIWHLDCWNPCIKPDKKPETPMKTRQSPNGRLTATAILAFAAGITVCTPLHAQVLDLSELRGYYKFESNFDSSYGTVNATGLNSATAGNGGGLIGNAATLQPTTTTSQGYAVGIGYGAASASATNLGQNFTISTWFKLDNPPVANAGATPYRYFIYEGKTSFDASVGLRGDLGGVAGINDLQIFTDSTTTPSTANSANFVDAITPGAWQHVMQTYSVSGAQTLITTYVNGVKFSTVLNPTTVSVTDTGINFGRARDAANTRGFDGQMDETALFSRSVSEQEAFTMYNLGTAGFPLDAVITSQVKADNSDLLDDGTAWVGGTAPTGAELMVFDSIYTQTIPLNPIAPMGVAGVRVGSGSNLVDIGNIDGVLTIGTLGVDMIAAGRDLTISKVQLGGNQNWGIGAGRTFTIGSDTALTGAYGITKLGAGTVILNGNNTNTGTTRIGNGTMEVTGGTALGDTSTVTLDNVAGATLKLNSSETVGTIAGGGSAGGSIDLQGNSLTVAGANTSTYFAGTLTGTGALVKSGSGILTLAGTNTYSGGTSINSGVLTITALAALPGYNTNGAYAVAAGATLGVTNAVTDANVAALLGTTNFAAGSFIGFDTSAASRTPTAIIPDTSNGALGVTKLGTNKLILDLANTYSGGTNIIAGSITTANTNGFGTGPVTVGAGTSYGATYASGGAPFLVMTSTAAATLPNNIILPNPGSTAYYALQKLAASSTTGTNLNLTGTISGGGANSILQLDSATGGDSTTSFTLSGTNTLSGQIRLNRGCVILTNVGSLGNASLFVQTNGNATDGNIRFTNAFTLPNNIIFGSTNGNTINTGANDVILSGVVSGGAAWSKVNGAGTLTLAGINTGTGNITVNAGTIKITGTIFSDVYNDKVITLASGTTLELQNWGYDQTAAHTTSLGGLTANATALVINGATIRVVGTTPTSYNRGFTVNAGGATFEAGAGANWEMTSAVAPVFTGNPSLVFTGAGTGRFDKVFTGTGGLTKSGTGRWTLGGDNTYTGATSVTGGTLVVSGNQPTATGSVSVANAATTLAGSGTIGGATTLATGTILAPGVDGVGTLAFADNLTLDSGSSYAVEITSATTNDKVTIAPTKTLAAGGTIAITLSGYTPVAGDVFDIADADSITGSPVFDFANAVLPSGLAWDTDDFTTSGVIKVVSTATAGYATWAGTNAPTGTATDDFDNDGVSNGVEYVLGGDKDTNDIAKLPAVSSDGTDMTFTFIRKQSSIGADLALGIEVGTTLATWPDFHAVPDAAATNNPGVTVVDNLDGTDTITLTLPHGTTPEMFARLKVIITPPAP